MSAADFESLDHWLRRLEWSLGGLPAPDTADIVREARAHVQERIAQGMSERDALAALGAPKNYARAFQEEFELTKALSARRFLGMLRVATRLQGSVAAGSALIFVCCSGLLALGVMLTAVMRLFDPVHWGLWLSNHGLWFGSEDTGHAHELLGGSIYLVAVLALIGFWLSGLKVVIWALGRLARR